jgi:Homeodomain-like domain
MSKIYRVTLTDTDREELTELLARRSEQSLPVKHAYILLAANAQNEQRLTDQQISETYRVSPRTVERTRQRFVMESFQVAVWGKKREVFKEKTLTGEVEAKLVALRGSQPPAGYAKWSMQLLAERMVELQYVEHISRESARQMLKKTR